MRTVLGVSTVLGVTGVVAAFGLFYLGERVFHLDRDRIQTLMYLKLSVAGHLTIFLTRTRGPFWSIRPARVLWMAVLGTQAVATLIAVYGLFMTPLGWGWALLVWIYALAWFLVNDRVKLLAYRILGTRQSAAVSNPPKPDLPSKPALPIDAAKPGAGGMAPTASTPPMKEAPPTSRGQPQGGVANAGLAPESAAKPAAGMAPTASTPPVKEAPPTLRGQPQGAVANPGPAPAPAGAGAAGGAASPSGDPVEATPELVLRVHALYEELGRQDVRAVQKHDEAAAVGKKGEQ
jgi:H+-transporting ATPase